MGQRYLQVMQGISVIIARGGLLARRISTKGLTGGSKPFAALLKLICILSICRQLMGICRQLMGS